MELDLFAWNLLVLTQEVDIPIKVVTAESLLIPSQSVSINLANPAVGQRLGLHQQALVSRNISVSAGNTLSMSQSTKPRTDILATSSRFFAWQDIAVETGYSFFHSLDLEQAVSVDVTQGVFSQLTLSQSVTVTFGARNLSASNTLTMSSKANSYKDSPSFYAFPITIGGSLSE